MTFQKQHLKFLNIQIIDKGGYIAFEDYFAFTKAVTVL